MGTAARRMFRFADIFEEYSPQTCRTTIELNRLHSKRIPRPEMAERARIVVADAQVNHPASTSGDCSSDATIICCTATKVDITVNKHPPSGHLHQHSQDASEI